ncbi:hypothetical protein RhiJN_06695 [Ceratobasidium sp. AG-Ba]|nr:hypothetical protein RhiJN_06695 [Ceratobasidium sp. AG-Ba]QRW07600.1 hypothetical protein RhiLY_06599 [Ceratobasidium sp. AG-Ba]
MQLASTACKAEESTITNCWRHTRLAADGPPADLPEASAQDFASNVPEDAAPLTAGEEPSAEIAARVGEM